MERIGGHDLSVKAQAGEICGEQLEPFGRAVDRHDQRPPPPVRLLFRPAPHRGRRSACREPAAATSPAMLRPRPAPTIPVRIAFKFGDRHMCVEARRAGRQHHWPGFSAQRAGSFLTLRSTSARSDALPLWRARRSRHRWSASAERAKQACHSPGDRSRRRFDRDRGDGSTDGVGERGGRGARRLGAAAFPARSTAAWSGISRKRICAAGATMSTRARRRAWACLFRVAAPAPFGACRGGGATRRDRARRRRSRASRPPLCCGKSAASRSSSGRDEVRTSATARDAATLAAMPAAEGPALRRGPHGIRPIVTHNEPRLKIRIDGRPARDYTRNLGRACAG